MAVEIKEVSESELPELTTRGKVLVDWLCVSVRGGLDDSQQAAPGPFCLVFVWHEAGLDSPCNILTLPAL